MARKGWDSLSPNYRRRLEKAGLSKSDYESGVSLSKARGHAKTPEHGVKNVNKAKYPEYFSQREKLIQELQRRKREMWGDRPRWDESRSMSHIRQKPISNQALKWALEADESDLIDAIREDAETFLFLGYH